MFQALATSSFHLSFKMIVRVAKVSTEVIKRGPETLLLTLENPIPPGFVGLPVWSFCAGLIKTVFNILKIKFFLEMKSFLC